MSSSAAPDPPFQNLARQANKLMDQLQKGYYNFCSDETWTPSVNLYETAHTYLVCVDLAGVEKAKIDLEVSDGRLKLKGSRPVPTFEGADAEAPQQPQHEPAAHQATRPSRKAAAAPAPESQEHRVRIHLMEIDHGSFAREVELPQDVDRDKISATYTNGMLWVEIPKK